MSSLFKHLPAVDKAMDGAIRILTDQVDINDLPRAMVKDLVNEFLDGLRLHIREGRIESAEELALDVLAPRLAAHVLTGCQPHFRRVINATGVVVHTNMGRSLMAEEATRAVAEACDCYSNLELDLATGERGSRYSHIEELLCKLTGAEAALAVNNNAAAVLLTLETLTKGREVIVSRGQLVEIGGSFRIPEVMEKSGATLHEVGATNRTHLRDYENAINENTGALLRVHTSNYRIIGFTKEVGLEELRELGDKHDLPVIDDLGSGNFVSHGILAGEPTVQATVAQGADVVTFSGDKVLGGPQAGLIVGKKKYLDEIKSNPLNRALRIDKMTLAGIEATLRLYLDEEKALQSVPTLRMITANMETLKSQAGRLARMLRTELGEAVEINTRKGNSRVGGGSYPEHDLPTVLVCLRPKNISVRMLKERLLETTPPMIARVEDNELRMDPRTLHTKEHRLVAAALAQALKEQA